MAKVLTGNIAMVLLFLAVAYITVFLWSKYVLAEGFEFLAPAGTKPLKKGDDIPVQQDAGADPWTKPFSVQPIMKVDDYDQDIVQANEGDRQYSQAQINTMTSQRPFDWPGLPPSAANFQTQQAQWQVDITKAAPINESQYAAIEGFQVLPPDTEAIEAEEQKLLKTYVPACSKDLKYDVDDAKDLISKIYEKKGLIPMVDVRDDGVYEVYETKEAKPKIVWEDEVEASTKRAGSSDFGQATFEVPQVASDVAVGLDPFFEPGPRLRADRSTYMTWTPGLERSFAPNLPRTNWY